MLLATNFLPGCFMTRKKKLVCFAIVAALIPAVYFFMRPSVPKHNINPASPKKIIRGMTLEEVEAILGVPSGDYTTGPTTSIRNRLWGRGGKEWASDDGLIIVWFDPQDRVENMRLAPVIQRTGLSWFERLQIWLGLREKTERINIDWSGGVTTGPY